MATGAPNNQLALARRNYDMVRQQLNDKATMARIASAIMPGSDLTPQRAAAVVLQALVRNPKLCECTPNSIVNALVSAAELGLEVGGSLGLAFLVPYRDKKRDISEVQLQIGFRGLGLLLRRHGEVKKWETRIVYEGDYLKVRYGLNPMLEHEPRFQSTTNWTSCYAVVWFESGEPQFEFMDRSDVEKIRDASLKKIPEWKVADSPWVTAPLEMARKTVFRRLFKSISLMSAGARETFERVENHEAGVITTSFTVLPDPVEEEPTPPPPPHDQSTGEVVENPPPPPDEENVL